MNLIQLASLLASAALVTSLSACQGAGASGTQNQPLPVALSQPESDPSPPKETSRSPCGSLSDGFQCLAVKYVSYSDSQSGQLLKEEEAQQNLETVNRLWEPCKIQFTLGSYINQKPETLGLSFSPIENQELSTIRSAFSAVDSLLVVVTGNWNRSGSLGSTGANAWATLPGTFPSGIVMEQDVATFGNIVAHELGHLLGLDHSSTQTDLMSPIIYENSSDLPQSACQLAQATIASQWRYAVRSNETL